MAERIWLGWRMDCAGMVPSWAGDLVGFGNLDGLKVWMDCQLD